MSELANKRRAKRAEIALRNMPSFDEYDWRANLVDLLTDLRHFADKKQLDFNYALESSYNHYLEERREAKGWKRSVVEEKEL